MECIQSVLAAAQQRWMQGDHASAQASVDAALDASSKDGTALDDLACAYNQWADLRFATASYDDVTLAHYRRAHDLLLEMHGTCHPDVANVLNNLATLSYIRGRYAESEQMARRAETIVKELLARIDEGSLSVDPDVQAAIRLIQQQAVRNVATALRASGRYAEGESVCREVLRLAEAQFSADDPQVATAAILLGVVLKYAGRYDEAEGCYSRALAILDTEPGQETVDLADLLYNLGGLLHARGRFAEAEPFARRALALARRLRGDAHPDVAIKEGALAVILAEQQCHEEAEALYRHALEVLESAVGSDHPDVALTCSNLGSLVGAQGRFGEAEALHRLAWKIHEREHVVLGLVHQGGKLRDLGSHRIGH